MKKFFKILGLFLLCLIVMGHVSRILMKPAMQRASERTAFERMLERADKDCPIQVALGKGAVNGIKLENGFVTYYISYDKDVRNVFSTLNNEEKVKEGLLMCFLCVNAQGNNNGDMVMDILIREKCGLKVVVTESASGRFECSATVDEIKSLRKKFQLNPHEALFNLLSLTIESEKAGLPMKIEEGMVMTDYILDSDNIVMKIEVDEEMYKIENMIENKEFLKASIINEGLNDVDSKAMLDLCKVSHTGLVYYIYGNSSHQNLEIKISSDEIRQIVKTPANACIN